MRVHVYVCVCACVRVFVHVCVLVYVRAIPERVCQLKEHSVTVVMVCCALGVVASPGASDPQFQKDYVRIGLRLLAECVWPHASSRAGSGAGDLRWPATQGECVRAVVWCSVV